MEESFILTQHQLNENLKIELQPAKRRRNNDDKCYNSEIRFNQLLSRHIKFTILNYTCSEDFYITCPIHTCGASTVSASPRLSFQNVARKSSGDRRVKFILKLELNTDIENFSFFPFSLLIFVPFIFFFNFFLYFN